MTNETFEQLKVAYESGLTRPLAWRRAQLNALHRLVMENRDAFISSAMADLGKPAAETVLMELNLVAGEAQFVRNRLGLWTARHPKAMHWMLQPAAGWTIAEPKGVVLIISPWNYPVLLALEPMADALAAGNAVCLKPSELSPNTSKLLAELVPQYLDAEAVRVVEGGPKETGDLLKNPFNHIFYTGGGRVGKIVMRAAAENLTPVTLELGGKSPCFVDRTADINVAARRIVWGKFTNAGQTCVAPDYLLVQEDVKDKFLEYLKYWIDKMFGVEPLKDQDYPKIINEKHYERIMKLIEGETIVKGGYGNKKRLFIAPTVLDHITEKSSIMQEEIFGPVLPVLTYRCLKEAEDFIKKGEKSLALYLFTGKKQREQKILQEISFGGGCINDTIIHLATSRMGFGGVGASGMGCYHGKRSFDTFSHTKSIVKRYQEIDLPIRYQPYTSGKRKLLRLFLK